MIKQFTAQKYHRLHLFHQHKKQYTTKKPAGPSEVQPVNSFKRGLTCLTSYHSTGS